MTFHNLIAPLQEKHIVHDDGAVPQQMHHLAKSRQPLAEFGLVLFVIATHAVKARKNIGPCTPAVGQLFAKQIVEPVAETEQVMQLHCHSNRHQPKTEK